MFPFRAICYGCAAVCGVAAIYFVTHKQVFPAAWMAGVALWNYYIGGKKK